MTTLRFNKTTSRATLRNYWRLARDIHRAPNISVAEAAKVIKNTQHDVNIDLMKEIAIICNRLDIQTNDVIEAASTK